VGGGGGGGKSFVKGGRLGILCLKRRCQGLMRVFWGSDHKKKIRKGEKGNGSTYSAMGGGGGGLTAEGAEGVPALVRN